MHTGGGTLRYRPGLDGLRAVAVCGVVAYHLGASWLPGGFLGVSLFMTLSGYLVTGLLLEEFHRTTTVSPVRFWGRRARRLLPAAYAVIAVLAVTGHLASGGQTAAALTYAFNWFELNHHVVYSDLFSRPSPLLHLWSLAVEEQFYIVLPLVAWFALRRWRTRGLTVAFMTWAVVGTVYGAVIGTRAAYMNTVPRSAEFAIGGLLAMAGVRAVKGWMAAAAVALMTLLWLTAREHASDLFRGVLIAHALAAAVVIAWVATSSPRILANRAFVAVGRASYALYLVHWPVFVLLRGPVLTKLLVAVTLTAALHLLVERPARFARWAGWSVLVAAATTGTVVAQALLAPAAPTIADTLATSPPGRPRLLVIGDSTATYLLNGGTTVGDTHQGLIAEASQTGVPVVGAGIPGCAYLLGWRSKLSDRDAEWIPSPDPTSQCGRWPVDLSSVIARFRPTVILFFAGPMLAREWMSPDGKCDGTAEVVCVRAWMIAGLTRVQDVAGSIPLVWATAPVAAWHSSQGGGEYMDNPSVVGAVNDLLIVRPHIDFAFWFAHQPDQTALRLPLPDQTHLSAVGANRAGRWVLSALGLVDGAVNQTGHAMPRKD